MSATLGSNRPNSAGSSRRRPSPPPREILRRPLLPLGQDPLRRQQLLDRQAQLGSRQAERLADGLGALPGRRKPSGDRTRPRQRPRARSTRPTRGLTPAKVLALTIRPGPSSCCVPSDQPCLVAPKSLYAPAWPSRLGTFLNLGHLPTERCVLTLVCGASGSAHRAPRRDRQR